MSAIHEFKDPIAVTTPLGNGYLFYVQPGGWKENDILAVILKEGGRVYHFRTDQIRIWANGTWDITPDPEFNKQSTP